MRARPSPSSAPTAPANRLSSKRSPACCRARLPPCASNDRDIGALPAYEIVKLGIALVPEGRRLFSSLSVEENLLVGAYGRHIGGPWDLAAVYRLFPVLRERRHTPKHGTVRRPATDGRHRAELDVEPAHSVVRRAQPRAGADRHSRHLCGARRHQGERHQRGPGRAGSRPRHVGRGPGLLLSGRARQSRAAGRRS